MGTNYKLKSLIFIKYGSQVNFAYHLKIHEALLSKIVRGWRQPDENLRRRICEKLGAKEDEIFATN